jgi:uncharacterized protein YacL
MQEATKTLDDSFNTMFIFVSVFIAGIILPAQLARGETSVLARSAALTQLIAPIIMLILSWWLGQFYAKVYFKFLGWYVLLTLVSYTMGFLSVMAGIDAFLGLNPLVLVLVFQVFGAVLVLYPLRKIVKRYQISPHRRFSKRETWLTRILCLGFMVYWLVVPWDLSALLH